MLVPDKEECLVLLDGAAQRSSGCPAVQREELPGSAGMRRLPAVDSWYAWLKKKGEAFMELFAKVP